MAKNFFCSKKVLKMEIVFFPRLVLPRYLARIEKMSQNERFLLHYEKTDYRVIYRFILCIFGHFQKFQISRFQKIWKVSENSRF